MPKRKFLSLIATLLILAASEKTRAQCNEPSFPLFCTFTVTPATNPCRVTLDWRTETEPQISSTFIIQRSSDGITYYPLAVIPGHPGSVSTLFYSYVDNNPYKPGLFLFYQIQVINSFGNVAASTSIKKASPSCTGQNPCNYTPVILGFSSPMTAIGASQQLTLSGSPSSQPAIWTSSNTSIATITPTGSLVAVGYGTCTITGKYVGCTNLATKTLIVAPPYTITANPCSGIYTTSNLTGNPGDVVVLSLSYGGWISWNGQSNGTGAVISLICAGQNSSASTQHYYGSTGFSLYTQVTFTMPSSSVPINTTAVVNNSSTMFSSTATLTVVSVNGIPIGNQGVVCGGNSGGSW
jgi:hypothetical protein